MEANGKSSRRPPASNVRRKHSARQGSDRNRSCTADLRRRKLLSATQRRHALVLSQQPDERVDEALIMKMYDSKEDVPARCTVRELQALRVPALIHLHQAAVMLRSSRAGLLPILVLARTSKPEPWSSHLTEEQPKPGMTVWTSCFGDISPEIWWFVPTTCRRPSELLDTESIQRILVS